MITDTITEEARDQIRQMQGEIERLTKQLGKVRGDAIQECIDLCNELSDCNPQYIASRMLDLTLSDD